jgi:hypothetical protein
MIQSINLPLCTAAAVEYGGWAGLRAECGALGIDGVEGIWAGEDIPADFPPDLLTGYHLTFFSDWLDFYRGDHAALVRKFGDLETAWAFYGGRGPDALLYAYRRDLDRARSLGAKYVVFHVSDVSIEECYTYRWEHEDSAVIDAAAEIINTLLDGASPTFDFLVENQWWAGLTLTDRALTARLLDAVAYPRKGILLDTGHLLNTDPALRTQREGLQYLHAILDRNEDLCRYIRGIHLHQSLSGAYVQANTGFLPEDLPREYWSRFAVSYQHILQIDRHQPWTDPAVAQLIDRISPAYLTHELSARDRAARRAAALRQIKTIQEGARANHADRLPNQTPDLLLPRASQ